MLTFVVNPELGLGDIRVDIGSLLRIMTTAKCEASTKITVSIADEFNGSRLQATKSLAECRMATLAVFPNNAPVMAKRTKPHSAVWMKGRLEVIEIKYECSDLSAIVPN